MALTMKTAISPNGENRSRRYSTKATTWTDTMTKIHSVSRKGCRNDTSVDDFGCCRTMRRRPEVEQFGIYTADTWWIGSCVRYLLSSREWWLLDTWTACWSRLPKLVRGLSSTVPRSCPPVLRPVRQSIQSILFWLNEVSNTTNHQ